MRIMICGSMRFAKEMMKTKQKLDEMGHSADVPSDTQRFIDDPGFTTDNHEENYRHALETDIMRECFNKIADSDAIVVLNHAKNGIPGHIGASSLIEIGLAYYLNKKIFLLHHPPDVRKEKSTHEILIMQPVILDGDVGRINSLGN